MAILTQNYLKEILYYEPKTGEFTWIVNRHNRRMQGDKAGSRRYQNGKPHTITIGIGGWNYPAGCVAWLYMTGDWPQKNITNADGDPFNNRWDNLILMEKSKKKIKGDPLIVC